MGRIKDLLKALSTNWAVMDEEETQNMQKELREFQKAHAAEFAESSARTARLEKGLDSHQKRESLQKDLEVASKPNNFVKAVGSPKKSTKREKSSMEREDSI